MYLFLLQNNGEKENLIIQTRPQENRQRKTKRRLVKNGGLEFLEKKLGTFFYVWVKIAGFSLIVQLFKGKDHE